ncbi:MAG: GDCCVxC domain-containing (seleno)protein [Paludibacter sp.]
MEIIPNSVITCPNCGRKKEEIMPTDACQYFYECENCKTVLKPLQGDCCVYCSYGSVKCPSIQEKKNVANRQTNKPTHQS